LITGNDITLAFLKIKLPDCVLDFTFPQSSCSLKISNKKQ